MKERLEQRIGLQYLRRQPPLTKPFQKVTLDIVGLLSKTHASNQYILTFQDHFFQYAEAFHLLDQKATTIAIFIKEIICRHDTPEKVLTGQGTNFTSELFQQLSRLLGIEKLLYKEAFKQ